MRLWSEDGSHAFGRERHERCIVDYHREMKETAQRLCTGLDLRKEPPHIIGRADIRRHDAHFHTALLQVLNKLAGLRTRSAAPAREHKMARTALSQPPSQHFAVSAESAGNQDSIRPASPRIPGRAIHRAAEQKASGTRRQLCRYVFHPTSAETRNRCGEAGNARKGSGRNAPFSTNPEISSSIWRVSSSLPWKTASMATTWNEALLRSGRKRDARVLVNVAFTDLDEAAELGETGETHRDRFPGERVQNHVHSLAIG